MIKVSIDGLFSPVLESGLAPLRLESLMPEVQNAHRELMSRRGRDVGFYDLPLNKDCLKSITAEVTRLRSLADDLIVLGMGGSSLGGQAIGVALGPTVDRPFRVHFIDNVDPSTLGALLEHLQPERTAAVAISKSGETIEVLAQLLILRRWFRVTLGQGETRLRMTFVTDPSDGILRDIAKSEGIRAFDIPRNVSGRYSVLTPAGLLPAAFLGVDVAQIQDGAASMVQVVCRDEVWENPACLFAAGAFLALKELGRSNIVMMPYCDGLRGFTAWFVHLWAQSLGKRLNRLGEVVRTGQTPITALGTADQHSQFQLFVDGPPDKVVTMIHLSQGRMSLTIPDELGEHTGLRYLIGRDLSEIMDAERRSARSALLAAGVPVLDVSMSKLTAASLGGLFVLFEAACALMGVMLGINPLEQVKGITDKQMTLGLLGQAGYESQAAEVLLREGKPAKPESA